MITMKEYADMHKISYEAIRKQVDRYRADLEGHIISQGRLRFLDDEAVEFLNARRRENSVVIYNSQRTEEEERVKAELDALKIRFMALQEKLLESQNRELQLQKTEALYLALQQSHDTAIHDLETERAKRIEDSRVIAKMESEAIVAHQEADKLKEQIAQGAEAVSARDSRISELQEKVEHLTSERDEAQKDSDSYQRTWFGLYRKITKP